MIFAAPRADDVCSGKWVEAENSLLQQTRRGSCPNGAVQLVRLRFFSFQGGPAKLRLLVPRLLDVSEASATHLTLISPSYGFPAAPTLYTVSAAPTPWKSEPRRKTAQPCRDPRNK